MNGEEILGKSREPLRRAFGAPIDREGVALVPVAIVLGGGGRGRGEGKVGEPAGEGGGFGGLVYPIGAYAISNGTVRFVPTFNVTRIVMGLLFLVRMAAKRRRRR